MNSLTDSSDFVYDFETVTGSLYHMDARRPIDRLLRYQKLLGNRMAWKDLEFEGKEILEFGCGPLLGWAPIATYLGCERYFCVEPGLREELVRSKEVTRRFFLPMYYQLDALFERGLSFEQFKTRLFERMQPMSQPLEHCQLPDKHVDLVYSNGVIQHVSDLENCFRQIQRISRPDTRQFHVIHFADHHSPPDRPFDAIYSVSPEEYLVTRSLLNLKRPSEILALFERHGLDVKLVPYYRDERFSDKNLHPYWRRFSPDDLSIQFAFFVN